MKRPDFEAFRETFLHCLSAFTGRDLLELPEVKWAEVGAEDARRELLEVVIVKLRESHGVEFEINHRLLSLEGPVESLIIQAYHELNTIYLMERIYAKIRAKLN